MKSTNSLAQQILKAQEVFDAWPDSRKSGLRLEGADIFMSKSGHMQDKSVSLEKIAHKKPR
ncbi:hypothetical protein [Pseudomonas asplenii]|uniref:hypothetical protein n=1 Tax=Pseudomonas asplenii TaxID=53407 RepID=UPI0012FA326B|nr:hypothetical protein [Pseudomonas fuscovaginae]